MIETMEQYMISIPHLVLIKSTKSMHIEVQVAMTQILLQVAFKILSFNSKMYIHMMQRTDVWVTRRTRWSAT